MGTEIDVVSSSLTASSTVKWKITNFSELNAQDGTHSDVFSIGDYKWRVLIYPKGEKKVYDHLSLFLKSVDLKKPGETRLIVEINSQTCPNNSVIKGGKYKFLGTTPVRTGWTNFMPLSELHDPAKGYISNDTLVITIAVACRIKGAELNVDGGAMTKESNTDYKVPECKRCKIKDERQ